MNPGEITSLGMAELARAIAAGKVSAVAAMEATLERAEAAQPRLNCFIRIDREEALAAARLADRQLARGYRRGPLHGVPMAHKDMYYRRGVVSTCGSKILREVPAQETATVLERLDAAGAIQFGVLNMAEFAMGPTGHNWHFGHCRNPWDPERITGGSSSGSGASVAARANFAALGSDTGGSIRLPAAFCGIAGVRPTWGRVPRAGLLPLAFSLDTVGPLARTVEDLALFLEVIAGADPRDPTCEARAVPHWSAQIDQPIKGLRIGRPRRHFYDDCDAEVRAALEASLEVFRRLGASVVDVDLPELAPLQAAGSLVSAAEGGAVHDHWLRSRPQDYSPQVRERLEKGLAFAAVDYVAAIQRRPAAIAAFCEQVFSKVDLVHGPVVSFATPTIAETDLAQGEPAAQMMARTVRLTRPFSYLGFPVVCANAGFTRSGMPVGMQLMGRPFDEASALRAGHAFQRATDWHLRAPQL